eukprot:2145765-Pyramimonas_sp.AAC.1
MVRRSKTWWRMEEPGAPARGASSQRAADGASASPGSSRSPRSHSSIPSRRRPGASRPRTG